MMLNVDRVVVIDCETTTRNFGDPFDPCNKLCSVGILENDLYTDYPIEYSGAPYAAALAEIHAALTRADVVVGFNLKFDLHWLRRYLHGVLPVKRFWDCQLGEYLFSYQQDTFPSLDASCIARGLGSKLDVVANDYWKNGLDTTDVPYPILADYLQQDVRLTRDLFDAQARDFTHADEKLYKLFQLGCEDLRWLAEAEWNGLSYDGERGLKTSETLTIEQNEITAKLAQRYGDKVNWDSSDHVSTVLFGGTLYVPARVKYIRQLKDGPVERERNGWDAIEYGGIFKPDPRHETKGDLHRLDAAQAKALNDRRIEAGLKPLNRTYSVAEGVLRNLPPKGKSKDTVALLLRRSEITKLLNTYYNGIPALIAERGWDRLHGSFNQSATRTGRLSSSRPNLQNFASDIKPLFRSQFE